MEVVGDSTQQWFTPEDNPICRPFGSGIKETYYGYYIRHSRFTIWALVL